MRLQNCGSKIHSKNFILIFENSITGCSRLAVTVSKKVDKSAVTRNLIRRRLKEFFRVIKQELVRPIDLVIIAKQSAKECSFLDIDKEIYSLLKLKGHIE